MQQKTPLGIQRSVKGDRMPRYHLASPSPRGKGPHGVPSHPRAVTGAPVPASRTRSTGRLRGHVHRVPPRPLSPNTDSLWRFSPATLPIIAFGESECITSLPFCQLPAAVFRTEGRKRGGHRRPPLQGHALPRQFANRLAMTNSRSAHRLPVLSFPGAQRRGNPFIPSLRHGQGGDRGISFLPVGVGNETLILIAVPDCCGLHRQRGSFIAR